jgi:hypothetical protein
MHLTTFKTQPTKLFEFYKELKAQQTKAHGEDYCSHHGAIIYFSYKLCCDSYRELGTHQGASAAAACLYAETLHRVELIDISFDIFRPYQPLFEEYCKHKKISLILNETSSLDPNTAKTSVDLLFIDSKHEPNHLRQELNLHANSVSKCIIFHDTTAKPKLFNEIQNFLKKNSNEWELAEHFTQNVGYTVIIRKHQ